MLTRRVLVDRCLGAAGITGAVAASVLAYQGAVLTLSGPSLARRIAGLAWISVAVPVAITGSYIGWMLLRYPAERRSTAAEIAWDAARQRTPLTRWMEE
jgi:hypothetical protein